MSKTVVVDRWVEQEAFKSSRCFIEEKFLIKGIDVIFIGSQQMAR